MPRKPTLDDYVGAVLDRDSDMPYAEVLEIYGITPNQFLRAINHDLSDLINTTSGGTRRILQEIQSDNNRKVELFRMGEEFVQQQYLNVRNKRQKRIYGGTYYHPENTEHLVYFALTHNNQELASVNRTEVIEGVKSLPTNLAEYFHGIGLAGLMTNAFGKGENNSPLAVLRVFDNVYQRKTGDASLFDLSQEEHLHEWEKDRSTPQSYWKKRDNVERAVYHTLTENNPKLTYTNRVKVIEGIKSLPTNLLDYFHSLGLIGLMSNAFGKGERGSPLAVLKVFDKAYQRTTGDISLFDLSQEDHLHEWGDNFNAPNDYWRNQDNVERAVYHALTENNQQLASLNRAEVIEGVKSLPTNLVDYFHSRGFSGLMVNAFGKGERGSPLAVLKVFDKAYQRTTGDISLFDQTQQYHLEFESRNRLIRQVN